MRQPESSTKMLRSGFGSQVRSTSPSEPSFGFGTSVRDASLRVSLGACPARPTGPACCVQPHPTSDFWLCSCCVQQYLSPEHAKAMSGNNSQGPVYKIYVSVLTRKPFRLQDEPQSVLQTNVVALTYSTHDSASNGSAPAELPQVVEVLCAPAVLCCLCHAVFCWATA